MAWFVRLRWLALLFTDTIGCRLLFTADALPRSPWEFHLSGRVHGGRPVYTHVKEDSKFGRVFLYHLEHDERQHGVGHNGQWLISDKIGSDDAVAYVDSWAILPNYIATASPLAVWQIYRREWLKAADATLKCAEEKRKDSTFFMEFLNNRKLTGFYVETGKRSNNKAVFIHPPSGQYLWQFPIDGWIAHWIIGEDVGTEHGYAYVETSAESTHPINITANFTGTWKAVAQHGHDVDYDGFRKTSTKTYLPTSELNAFEVLHRARKKETGFDLVLNNGLRMPAVGFGTGGLTRHQSILSIHWALEHGYRLLDSASEYHNEDIIGDIFHEVTHHGHEVHREEVFISTKVWPTSLGFHETHKAFYRSLEKLRMNYVDMYMIHWPQCYGHWEWMDCTRVGNPSGRWEHTYNMMEKLYAEGRIMSLGISNFNIDLIDSISHFAAMPPQVLQNWFDPSHREEEILSYCKRNGIAYQSYAPLRGLMEKGNSPEYREISQRIQQVVQSVSHTTDKALSKAQVILKWLLPRGVGIIPRSKSEDHIKENSPRSLHGWLLTKENMLTISDSRVHTEL